MAILFIRFIVNVGHKNSITIVGTSINFKICVKDLLWTFTRDAKKYEPYIESKTGRCVFKTVGTICTR